jgi:methylmalonyl-CoA mutase
MVKTCWPPPSTPPAYATLGEISDALEVAFDRYLVPSQCVTGVIAQSYHQSDKAAGEFDAIVAQTENSRGKRAARAF